MEMVPLLKKIQPDLDSQGRQEVIRNLWAKLKDQHKLAYVLMSRADREKVMYLARLNQIRDELRKAYPEEAIISQLAQISGQPTTLVEHVDANPDGRMHGLKALAKIEESINDE